MNPNWESGHKNFTSGGDGGPRLGGRLSSTYVIYLWYQVVPPAGMTDLTGYPKFLLASSPTTSKWYSLGM
jgi:hypothetical protein